MKQKHMFSLLDQTFTTIKVQIHGHTAPEPKKRFRDDDLSYDANRARMYPAPAAPIPTYTYKVPKDWNVRAGDLIVVPTRGDVSLSTVVTVDEFPVIDVDADFTYQWAVGVVSMDAHNELVENERKFGDTIQEIERVKQRESLVNSFRDSLPEGSAARALFESTTISLQAPPPAAPTAPPPYPAPGSAPSVKPLGDES